jgi:hypothetical protein
MCAAASPPAAEHWPIQEGAASCRAPLAESIGVINACVVSDTANPHPSTLS